MGRHSEDEQQAGWRESGYADDSAPSEPKKPTMDELMRKSAAEAVKNSPPLTEEDRARLRDLLSQPIERKSSKKNPHSAA